MLYTHATRSFLQDIAGAYDVIKDTLAQAEQHIIRYPSRGLSDQVRALVESKRRMEMQAAEYGLDLVNPAYAGMGNIAPILPLAVIANIGLSNVLAINETIKQQKPLTMGLGIQLILGGLLIGLFIPMVVKRRKP